MEQTTNAVSMSTTSNNTAMRSSIAWSTDERSSHTDGIDVPSPVSAVIIAGAIGAVIGCALMIGVLCWLTRSRLDDTDASTKDCEMVSAHSDRIESHVRPVSLLLLKLTFGVVADRADRVRVIVNQSAVHIE